MVTCARRCHVRILGNQEGVSLSRCAQVFPDGLCQALASGIWDQLCCVRDLSTGRAYWAEDAIEEDALRNQCLAAEEQPEEQPDPESQEPEQPGSVPEEQPRIPVPGSAPRSLKAMVQHAHDSMGHPDKERFIRILRLAGATDDAI